MNFDAKKLPIGWCLTKLSRIAILNPRYPDKIPVDNVKVSFIPMKAVSEMTGAIDLSEKRLWLDVSKGYTKFQEYDVLFAKITPCMENGKVFIAKGLCNHIGAGSTEFHVLRPSEAIIPKLLFYFLLRKDFRSIARSSMAGTSGHMRVPNKFLEEYCLTLPPLNEQQRIVKAIESYFSRLDTAVETLKRVKKNLERYRSSVLKAAVEGRLVPTEAELANKEGRDYEPADALLRRILKERRKKWIESETEKARARAEEKARKTGKSWTPQDNEQAVKNARARAEKKYKEPESPDARNLPDLPEGWCWVKIRELLKATNDGMKTGPFGSLLKKKDYKSQGIPVLGIENIKPMEFINNSKVFLSNEKAKELKSYDAEYGDVLVSRSGTVGDACVVPYSIEGARLSSNVMRLRFVIREVIPDFFSVLLNGSTFVKRQFYELCKGTTRKFINQKILYSLIFPFPPLDEQRRIINEINRVFSIKNKLETNIINDILMCEKLRQSILKWAFEGKLVDQDPDDEPAAVLLEKIKKEREAAEKSENSNRKKKNRRSKKTSRKEEKSDQKTKSSGSENK